MRDKRKIGFLGKGNLTAAIFLACLISTAFACGNETNKISGGSAASTDTCEGPDVNIECNFVDFPKNAGSIMKIAGEREPGFRIVIKCVLLDKKTGLPLAGAKIYAYQTDSTGHYTKDGTETGPRKWQGRLHSWCITDSEGKYEIHTIRPGKYPENKFPAHIHCAVKLPDGLTTYLNDFVFQDDVHVNEQYLNGLSLPGDNGVIELEKKDDNVFYGSRTTLL
jgi:protocatechuate 3,4-dioxygenase beta subunit